MSKKKQIYFNQPDFLLVALTCALVIFGVMMVFSASYYWSIDKNGTPFSFLFKDIVWAVSGAAIMLFTTCFDYHRYKRWAFILLCFGFFLLIFVLVAGANINGATRWLQFGPVTIMPGEIGKICMIIFVAWFLCRDKNAIHTIKGMLIPLAAAGVYFALIMKQPNMSTAITIVGIVLVMMFVAGLKMRYVFGLAGLAVAGFLALIIQGGGYRLHRLLSFTDPFQDALGDGYQVVQGLLALGSGGLTGVGLGDSVQKHLYLPEPQNDFILAIIGEELGFACIFVLFLVYLVLVWRGIKIALEAPDRFGMLLATGISVMIGLQVLFNVAVVTSSMPPTGVTLPFISYGGNALWLFMGSMGILLNISRQVRPEMAQAPHIKTEAFKKFGRKRPEKRIEM